MDSRGMRLLLLASVFTIATCGLIYELIAGTLASYLLGDSVTQFSTVIGVYLFAMGVGSWLSKFVKEKVLATFIRVEFLIGLIGGFSALLLFALFDQVASFRVLLYGLVFLTGALVGLEIPLLLRLLKDQLKFEDLVSRVLSLDYIGALAASLLFPLVLVPKLGLVRSSFLFGLLNAGVGLLALHFLRSSLERQRMLWLGGILSVLLLAAGFAGADRWQAWAERSAYNENIIFAHSSPYQRLILTRHRDDLRLYLNGNLQFSSRDEYRYHETLVHPVLSRIEKPKQVLVLGGGDGLAAREILRYPAVESITLVDLDAEMTRLFSRQPVLTALNAGSLTSPKLHVENADAFTWLETAAKRGLKFDAAIIDFPDPSNFSIGKLYSTAFYEKLRNVLSPSALISIQCTSPLAARKSFWCVDETLRACGYGTAPYHVYVPSFGEWGFILASPEPATLADGAPHALPEGLRYLTPDTLVQCFRFPPDMSVVPAGVNRLNNQVLVRHFEEEWGRYE
ncbi:polyamine aminopropyltransferase [Luteolibacter sp. LG18]|uniref:polyamine aminopropyltransferase n=1 Tax=Luteolibacter sp. LG18 TaxID=2819286 RepID=UPI002B2E011C|nr:polyamine aminopropyltransferase 1 [Luteolibacter sp. LG18]